MKWILVLLVACGSADRGPKWRPAGNHAPRDGGTLHVAVKDPVRTLDPSIAYDEISSIPVHLLFDTLVDYEPGGYGLVPRLAEHWDISADGKTYTFALRDAHFSDGTPVTSADFAYSFERALTTPDSPFGPMLANVIGAKDVADGKAKHAAGIVATVPRVLELHLDHPDAAFLYVLTMTFTTPQRAAHVADAGDQLRREPIGCGPFELALWDEGERLILRRSPTYWDPSRVHLDGIELRENVARDTQFLMFERGELDAAAPLSAPDALWLGEQAAWQPYVHQQLMLDAFGSRMNVRKPPFTDRRVRQGLNYALDKQHSVRLLGGDAVIAHGLLPPGMAGRDDALAPYPHDPAKARQLLAEAGYPHGFDIDYAIMADEEAERLAASLQSDLAEVGVRVRIVELSLATFGTAVARADGPAFSKGAWIADFPDPSSFLDAKFHSRMIDEEAATDDSFYANPELDALLDAARAEQDPAARAAMYRRAEKIVYDDAPWIWDYHQKMLEVTQPYVAGYAPHPVWLRDYTSAWLDVGVDGPVPR